MQSNQAAAAQVQHLQAHLQTQNSAAGQQHPQVITLQQLQNFLPTQQIQTITSADGHQVQVLSANDATPTKQIKQERFVLTPQMQPQPQVVHLQNLQSIPQQFIQVKVNRRKCHFCVAKLMHYCFYFIGWTNFAKCWQFNVSSGSTHANGHC